MYLKGKNVLIGISGSIAAYKSALLVRECIKSGAQVKVVMTESAIEFITPLTLATLSKNPVHSDFTENKDSGVWTNHVELGIWADVMIIAPCTANTLSKMATGNCDNFLLAVYLSARCPVFVAPAMDLDMYKHGTTAENLKIIAKNNNYIIEPNEGELASGLEGKGRMAEPNEIVDYIENHFRKELDFLGKQVLITAGPTYEKIDPVRFIGNHSSGKMGYALANAFADQGASVHLISGPTKLEVDHKNIKRYNVTSADEMYDIAMQLYPDMDIAIAAAAVADYRPKTVAEEKIKKSDSDFQLELEKTKDILKNLGKEKKKQFLVGFALETENELENAQGKLQRKNLDMIVLNSLKDAGAGFGVDTNKITVIHSNNKIINFELKSKALVALDILDQVKENIK